MNIIKLLKREPRTIIAIINFLSFFLPWISFDISVSGFGAVYDASESVTGFGMISYSVFGILFYITPVILTAVPFIENLRKYEKYIYLILPVFSIIDMFFTCSILTSAEVESTGLFDSSTKIPKLIGFWIALLCNIVIIAYTLIKNYHIRSVSDMEENIKKMQKINVESFSSAARELSSTLQSTTTVECKQCGFKMPRGKKFCSNCGSPIIMEPKVIQGYKCSKCGKNSDSKSNFCSDCGGSIISYTIATTCRNCGEKLSEGAFYCSSCGTKVEEEQQNEMV